MPTILTLTIDMWERIEFTDQVEVTPIWSDGVSISFTIREKNNG